MAIPVYCITLNPGSTNVLTLQSYFGSIGVPFHIVHGVDGRNNMYLQNIDTVYGKKSVLVKDKILPSSCQLGCLLSHLSTLFSIRNSDDDIAIVIEDDIDIKHIRSWDTYVHNISQISNNNEWDIIQMHTNNQTAVAVNYANFLLSGNPLQKKSGVEAVQQTSTACYMVQKRGIEKICNTLCPSPQTNTVIRLDSDVMPPHLQNFPQTVLVADIVLYSHVNFYIWAIPMIVAHETESLIEGKGKVNQADIDSNKVIERFHISYRI